MSVGMVFARQVQICAFLVCAISGCASPPTTIDLRQVENSTIVGISHHSLSARKLGVSDWIVDTYFYIPSTNAPEPESCQKNRPIPCFRDGFIDSLVNPPVRANKERFADVLGIQDPILWLKNTVISSPQMNGMPVQAIPEDVQDPFRKEGMPYLLHFETQHWGIRESPERNQFSQFKWTKQPYSVSYAARARYLDVVHSRVMGERTCERKTPYAFTLDQLTTDKGEVFRRTLLQLVEACASDLSSGITSKTNGK